MFIKKMFREFPKLSAMVLPLALGNLLTSAVTLCDVVVATKAGTEQVAGVALVSSFWIPAVLLAIAFLIVLIPMYGNAFGANDKKRVVNIFRHSFYLAIALAAFIYALIIFGLPHILPAMLDPTVREVALAYSRFLAPSALPLFLMLAMRFLAEGSQNTYPSLFLGIFAVCFNIPLNIFFVFGVGAWEGMGGAGTGLATTIVMCLQAFIMAIYLTYSKRYKYLHLLQHVFERFTPDWSLIKEIFKHGLPFSLALTLEVSAFAVVTLAIAPFGASVIGAQSNTMNIQGLFFAAFPLSIASALLSRVSFHWGANQPKRTQHVFALSLLIFILLEILTALLIYAFFPMYLNAVTDDPALLQTAITLMPFMVLLTLTDGVQVIISHALRAMYDNAVLIGFFFLSYWVIGLPLGYVLAFTDWIMPALGVKGFWAGLIIGTSGSALLMGFRYAYVYKRNLRLFYQGRLKKRTERIPVVRSEHIGASEGLL